MILTLQEEKQKGNFKILPSTAAAGMGSQPNFLFSKSWSIYARIPLVMPSNDLNCSCQGLLQLPRDNLKTVSSFFSMS